MLFLSFSGYDEDTDTFDDDNAAHPFFRTLPDASLSAGEKSKKAEYYDRVYIGWYDGSNYFQGTHLPYPNVDDIVIADDWSNFSLAHFSMRINNGLTRRSQILHTVDPMQKTTFKWISGSIPDVRALFYIRGKRYLCEKITASFTADNGISQLLKGVFYPVKD